MESCVKRLGAETRRSFGSSENGTMVLDPFGFPGSLGAHNSFTRTPEVFQNTPVLIDDMGVSI